MKVSEAELTQLYKQEPNAKKKEKLLAMLHILVKGKTITEVAEFLCKAYNTIKAWRARFLKHGPDGLDDKPRPGRPRKIKNQTLDKFIKKADPVFPSLVAEAVTAETGVECNAAKVRRRLHENDYTRKTPVPAYYRRDSVEDVLEWQKKMGYWISRLERDGFCLYAMDQATIMLDYQNKAGPWSPEGQRVYMGYYGQHRKIMQKLKMFPLAGTAQVLPHRRTRGDMPPACTTFRHERRREQVRSTSIAQLAQIRRGARRQP